jgi:hypothetical protein
LNSGAGSSPSQSRPAASLRGSPPASAGALCDRRSARRSMPRFNARTTGPETGSVTPNPPPMSSKKWRNESSVLAGGQERMAEGRGSWVPFSSETGHSALPMVSVRAGFGGGLPSASKARQPFEMIPLIRWPGPHHGRTSATTPHLRVKTVECPGLQSRGVGQNGNTAGLPGFGNCTAGRFLMPVPLPSWAIITSMFIQIENRPALHPPGG